MTLTSNFWARIQYQMRSTPEGRAVEMELKANHENKQASKQRNQWNQTKPCTFEADCTSLPFWLFLLTWYRFTLANFEATSLIYYNLFTPCLCKRNRNAQCTAQRIIALECEICWLQFSKRHEQKSTLFKILAPNTKTMTSPKRRTQ